MKRTVGFRFATGTLEKLDTLSEGSTRTAVLERLIEGAFQKSHKPVLEQKVEEAAEKVASWTNPPIDTPAAAKPPVQDISATKQVLRRKINPMTGQPFGAVPKK